jgi:hypothetical protein
MKRMLLTLCLALGLPACDQSTIETPPADITADIVLDTVGDAVSPGDSSAVDDTTETVPNLPDATLIADVPPTLEETEDDVFTADTSPPTPDTTSTEDSAEPMEDTSEPDPADTTNIAGDTTTNITCDPSKMGFTQANDAFYEFYEICIDQDASDEAQEVLFEIDPSLYCGVSGAFAGCSGSIHLGCHGDLEFVGATKEITEAKWAQLCALSIQDSVHIIGGGYWVN